VAKHWPAFAANGKGEVTRRAPALAHLGLTADNALADYADGKDQALERVAGLKASKPRRHPLPLQRRRVHRPRHLVEKLGGMRWTSSPASTASTR